MDSDDRRLVVQELVDLMEAKIAEASATDISRLAWLYLHLRNEARSLALVHEGLRRDPGNMHCQNLVERLER